MGSLWMSKQKWANFLCTCPSPLLGEIKPPTALKYTLRNILNIRMNSWISSFVACLLPIPSVCGYVSFISISMVKNVSLILLVSFIKVHVLLLVNTRHNFMIPGSFGQKNGSIQATFCIEQNIFVQSLLNNDASPRFCLHIIKMSNVDHRLPNV